MKKNNSFGRKFYRLVLAFLLCSLVFPSVSQSFNLFGLLKNSDKNASRNSFFVSKVIDGDTITLENNEKVRYLGIDAPETHRKENGKWTNFVEPFGEEATILNKRLVEGKTVTLSFDRELKDSYDRNLAYVYIDGRMVNTVILSEGLAFPYDISKLKNYSIFRLAFFNAIKAKKNLYKNFFVSTKLYEHIGLYGWYRGKINTVYYSNDKTVIKTDYLDIQLNRKGKSRIPWLKEGNICYFYGKLTKKRERYIILSDNYHHIVVE